MSGLRVCHTKQLGIGIIVLRSYDNFRNLSLIFLKSWQRKEHSTVIFKTTENHGVIDMGQIFMKMLEKSYSVVTVYAHAYIRYC